MVQVTISAFALYPSVTGQTIQKKKGSCKKVDSKGMLSMSFLGC